MNTKFLEIIQSMFGHKAKVDQVISEDNYDAAIGVCDATLFEVYQEREGEFDVRQISSFTKRNFSRRTFKTILTELKKKFEFDMTQVLNSIEYIRDYDYKGGRRAEFMILGKKRCIHEKPVYQDEKLLRYDYGTQKYLMHKLAEICEEELTRVLSEPEPIPDGLQHGTLG